MAFATFKDLCIDAVDPELLGRFWAGALGLTAAPPREDGVVRLAGSTPQHTVWVNPVPEPVTVKQRVHLDVQGPTGVLDRILGLGATPLDLESFRWKVLRDPEGGELCVFERAEPPAEPLYEIGIDSREPERIAVWWADALGAVAGHDGELWWVEQIPGAPFETLDFVPVPEPKTVKHRIHWDVWSSDPSLLTGDGATVLDEHEEWTVLADPEGNEFCVFPEES